MHDVGGPGAGPADRERPAVDGVLQLELDVVGVLSWALALRDVPLVTRLELTSSVAVPGARVRLEVRDSDGLLGAPVERALDLAPGVPVLLHDLGLRLDPQAWTPGGAARAGVVEVRVIAGTADLLRRSTQLTVLGAGQWQAAPCPLALELLAGHVLPGDPALGPLVGAATDLLAARTGDGRLPRDPAGSSSPARVDQTAAALVEALRRRAVQLRPGPVSWADTPQPVRRPGEVLASGEGSALDLTVLLAAALEQAGVRPLLWVTGAHAFLGYRRSGPDAETAVSTGIDVLAAQVEDGAVQLIETTLLVAGAEPATFGDLHRTPQAAWLTGDLGAVVGVVDVSRARQDGMLPLPELPRAGTPDTTEPPPTDRPVGPAQLLPDAALDDAALDDAALDDRALDELAGRLPLPVDTFQLRVIADALAGRSVVLTGAPGSGRTQALTALVARAVADGRRVLVVGIDPVLDVLARRLDDVGLAPVTLDLRAEPSAVRARLRSALRAGDDPPAADTPAPNTPDQNPTDPRPADPTLRDSTVHDPSFHDDALTTTRGALADHARRLHEPNAAGLSLYDAHCGLLPADERAPLLPVPVSFVAHTSERTVQAMRRALADLPGLATAAGPRTGHPWGFLDRPRCDLAVLADAVRAVDRCHDEAVRALGAQPAPAAALEALAAARTAEDVDAVALVLSGPTVPLADLDRARTPEWAAAAGTLLRQVAHLVSARRPPRDAGADPGRPPAAPARPALDLVLPTALDLPLPELAAEVDAAAAARFGRGKRLTAVLRQLAPVLRPGIALSPADVPALVAELLGWHQAGRALTRRAGAVPGLQVPADWNPLTDRRLVDRQVARLQKLTRATAPAPVATSGAGPGWSDPGGPAAALRRLVETGPAPDPAAAAAVAALRDAVAALVPAAETTPEQLAAWAGAGGLLTRWAATRQERPVDVPEPPSLHTWVAVLRRLELLHVAGLDRARQALLTGAVPAERALAAFDRGLAASSVAERLQATGWASGSTGDPTSTDGARPADPPLHEHLAAASAARAAVVRDLAAEARRAHPIPRSASGGPALPMAGGVLSERGDLTALLAGHADLVTTALPCVLADPATVARLLPDHRFDLVVIDDADQLPAGAASGLLGRARTAAVVVGRSAGRSGSGGPDLLRACVDAGLRGRRSGWHHRSSSEALAAASGGSAGTTPATLPAPLDAVPGGHPAVRTLRLPGTFTRTGPWPGTNMVEARAVVADVRRRIDLPRGTVPSVAVVTLHRQQQRLIDGLLRGAGNARVLAALRHPDGVLVVHVDDAIGLERDVVLLSLGCSAEPTVAGGTPGGAPTGPASTVPLDLGPVSRTGGERAVEVAISRARQQLVVVRSFDRQQLRAERTTLAGVRRLREFLDLADARPAPGAAPGIPDPHRDDVARALRARGLVVHTAVGTSDVRIDLTVGRPGEPAVLAVLLDGRDWARRGTVTDRDAVPTGALLSRWPAVERVWLPSWRTGREGVLDRLVATVAAAVAPAVPAFPEATAEPGRAGPAAGPAAAPEPDPLPGPSADEPVRVTARPTVTPAALPGELPFRAWTPARAGDPRVLRRLADPDAAAAVRAVLAAGIAAEGPVHRTRLAQLTAGAFGLARLPEARQEELLALLADRSEFLWPATLDRATWTGFRRHAGAADRPLEQVSPDEVGNAMVALCGVGAGMTRDELFARTLAVFGHARRHPVLVPHLELGLAAAVRAERVVRPGAGLLIRAA